MYELREIIGEMRRAVHDGLDFDMSKLDTLITDSDEEIKALAVEAYNHYIGGDCLWHTLTCVSQIIERRES